jgi:C-terminal processing protease CtpA/Prc
MLAENCKSNNYATLIGSETGGTQMGINGGQIFFLTLPKTQLEIDIPLIGYYPSANLDDQGIMPDIEVQPTIEDFKKKTDVHIKYIVDKLIKSK